MDKYRVSAEVSLLELELLLEREELRQEERIG